jgi:N-acylneuraminate cytidylyltransferase
MIDQRTVLGIIPARGGSKRIPRKNLQLVLGKPLIAWTVEEARKSNYIDRLILSSEDSEIIMIARELGCEVPFVRPAELARDETTGTEPILHALEQLANYECVVVLQPTSPLRIVDDIDGCIRKFHQMRSSACVSLAKCRENPRLIFRMLTDEKLIPLLPDASSHAPSEQFSEFYKLNGAVYVASTRWLQISRSFIGEGTVGYEMPVERSLDIDTEDDLRQFIAHLMKREGN